MRIFMPLCRDKKCPSCHFIAQLYGVFLSRDKMPCLFYMNLSNSKNTLPSQHSANKMFLHAKILFFNFKREGYCLKDLRKDINIHFGMLQRNDAMASYVPTLSFWTGGSRLQRATPVLPFLPEISRFEMTLASMSDIYEFFKSITLLTKSV